MVDRVARKQVRVANPLGLHIRPAYLFARLASGYESAIEIIKDGQGVNGKSVPDGIIDSYMTLTEMAATTPPLTLDQAAAVRVSLLIRGPTSHVAAGSSQKYVYNGDTVAKTDGYLRHVYTSTFTVRNQAH